MFLNTFHRELFLLKLKTKKLLRKIKSKNLTAGVFFNHGTKLKLRYAFYQIVVYSNNLTHTGEDLKLVRVYLTGMRAIGDYFETNLRHVLATEMRHCNHFHIAVTPNGWLRHICDSRTNVVRLSHEFLANVARHSRDIHATFGRHSHDVRPMKLRTFITIDRLTTFS